MLYPDLARKAFIAITFLFCALVFQTPTAAAAPEGVKPEAERRYQLRPGDEVELQVAPRKEYNCSGIILPDGIIYLPFGQIKAEGLTLPELAARAAEILNEKLVNPRVTAVLTHMAPPETAPIVRKNRITVVGAVRTVGPMELEEGLRLRKALDLAGGAEPSADLKQVIILHKDLTRSIVDISSPERVSDPRHNKLLQDGDSIEVQRLPEVEKPAATVGTVRIGGQVATPGQYELKTGMTLEDLIITAGRVSSLADVEQVQLYRQSQPVQTIDLIVQSNMGLKGKVLLKPGDEVFVPEQKSRIILIGNVPDPGAKVLIPGQTVREFFLDGKKETSALLNPATTDLKHIELIRPGNKVQVLDLGAVLKKAEHKDNVKLAIGDVLFLPPKKGKLKKGPLDYLQSLGPLGLLLNFF